MITIFVFAQVIYGLLLIGYITLYYYSIRRVTRQDFVPGAKLLWFLLIFGIPFGVFLPFLILPKPKNDKRKNELYVTVEHPKTKRESEDITYDDLFFDANYEKRKFY
jgi:hypothetical protein